MRWLLLLSLVPLACSNGDGEGRTTAPIVGTVTDVATAMPLAGVRVTSTPETQEVLTDEQGSFILEEAQLGDRYQVRAEADGYEAQTETLTVRITEDNRVNFALRRLEVCEPGAIRCAAGTDSVAFETCAPEGNAWDRSPCGENDLCLDSNPGCTVSVEVAAIIDAPGGVVRSQPVEGQEDAVINCGETCSTRYAIGTEVTLIATPLSQSSFVTWRGSCNTSDPVCTVTVQDRVVVGATFNASAFSLSVENIGPGDGRVVSTPMGIDCPGTCNAVFDRDINVTLQATPEPGSQFDGWRRDCSGQGDCTLTMDEPKDVRARFVEQQQSLTVTKNGTGAGTVTSEPDGIDCGSECMANFAENTMVTLTATPDNGSTFEGFGGDCTGATCMVTLDQARTVSAQFDGVSYPLTVTLGGNGNGAVTSNPGGINCGADCDESYGPDTMVTLTATPAADSDFTGWGGDCAPAGTALDCTVTMDAAKTASADFTAVPFFERPLAADGDCQLLLRFDTATPLADACGGADVAETGTLNSVTSRNARLGDARQFTAGSLIDTGRLGPAPPAATIEMQLRPDGNGFDALGSGALFSDQDARDRSAGVRIRLLDDGRIVAETHSAQGTTTATSASALTMGTWTHVAVTLDAAAGVGFFFDGTASGTQAGPLQWAGSSSTAWAGAERSATGPSFSLQGSIDEFRVSSTVRY